MALDGTDADSHGMLREPVVIYTNRCKGCQIASGFLSVW